jgi:hypothetical protein
MSDTGICASLADAYRMMWREAFLGESACDRFVARMLILALHGSIAAAAVVCILGSRL